MLKVYLSNSLVAAFQFAETTTQFMMTMAENILNLNLTGSVSMTVEKECLPDY